jgi:hypothetical protein
MGKCKKPRNVVKVDFEGETFGGGVALPILVQQSSKDGRHVEQTIHKISAPRAKIPLPTFDPSPAYEAIEHSTSPGVYDPMEESNVPERVHSCFSL